MSGNLGLAGSGMRIKKAPQATHYNLDEYNLQFGHESGHKDRGVGDDWKSGGAWDGMGKPQQLRCNCDITDSPAGLFISTEYFFLMHFPFLFLFFGYISYFQGLPLSSSFNHAESCAF